MNNTSTSEQLENSRSKILLAIITFAKLGFGTFFVAGSVYYHAGSHNEALQDFCKSIGRTSHDWYYLTGEGVGDWDCARDIIGGLHIIGSIFLLVSIVMEAFGPFKRNLYRTVFHIIGGIFIMFASMDVMLWKYEKWVEFFYDHPNFIPGCWITGGLVSALCQAHLIYCYRSRGCLTFITFLLAMIGSTLFMIFGIVRIYEVIVELTNDFYDDDAYMDWWNMCGGVLISASVVYILHSLLYPFACIKMNQEQDDSGTTYSNPNVYQQFPIQPLNSLDENKDVAAV